MSVWCCTVLFPFKLQEPGAPWAAGGQQSCISRAVLHRSFCCHLPLALVAARCGVAQGGFGAPPGAPISPSPLGTAVLVLS